MRDWLITRTAIAVFIAVTVLVTFGEQGCFGPDVQRQVRKVLLWFDF